MACHSATLRGAGADLHPNGCLQALTAGWCRYGVRGGTAPRQPLRETHGVWPRRVGWLSHQTVDKPALRPPSKPFPRAARDGGGRAVAGKLPDLSDRQPRGRRGRTCRPVAPLRWRRSLPRTESALPVPPGDPRSSILGHSTARRLPEEAPLRPETASEPRRRLRHVKSGPGARSPAREIRGPLIHEPTPTLEQVRAPVRGLHLVLDHMRQRRSLSGGSRVVGWIEAEVEGDGRGG